VLLREVQTGALLGLLIGCMGLLRISLWGWMGWWSDADVQQHYAILSVTIALTLGAVVLWGSLMGCMLPFVLKRLGLDPAASSTPFVATLVDVTGIVIYFNVALLVLSTTLLKPDAAASSPLQLTTPVEVVSLERERDGDPWLDAVVRTEAQKAAGTTSRVRIPMKGLPDGRVPAAGETIHLRYVVKEAEGVGVGTNGER
jgi:hypothetical protein